MATPYQTVYDAFLSKIKEDDWAWIDDITIVEADWKSILESALVYIKFPRVSLELGPTSFVNELTYQEIQLLATYMKVEWLNRTILSWENIKPFYSESDFSQANLLDKFNNLLEMTEKKADKLQHIYYRSINGRPFAFGDLAGKQL